MFIHQIGENGENVLKCVLSYIQFGLSYNKYIWCATSIPIFIPYNIFDHNYFFSLSGVLIKIIFSILNFTFKSKKISITTFVFSDVHHFISFIGCSSPQNLTNGNVTYQGTKHGDTASYTCWQSYVKKGTGSGTITCQTGTWTSLDMTCVYGKTCSCFNTFCCQDFIDNDQY